MNGLATNMSPPIHMLFLLTLSCCVQIRAKEARKIEAEMTRNPEDVKRRAMLQRLPELTRIVREYPLMSQRLAHT